MAERMRAVLLVALAATVGNMLQGWDNSTLAGSLLYIKEEFNLQSNPTVEGLIVSMGLIGATIITAFSGPGSDMLGRRSMLIISSALYFLGGLLMMWAPTVSVLLLARLLAGFGVGLALTVVPLYISETAPSEVRGQLSTFPQLMAAGGMFLSYCMVFGVSLMSSPSWRMMLGILSILSLVYLALTVFFLPESPRWLVSKGKMLEAKQVLQRLRGRDDVSGELALLVEGLGVGNETTMEEYIIGPADEINDKTNKADQVHLFGLEEGSSWIAKPITAQGSIGAVSHDATSSHQSLPFMDPIVALFASVHENLPSVGSRTNSMLFPRGASMLSAGGNQDRSEQWDEESQQDGKGYSLEDGTADSGENLQTPLLQESSLGIGGGWQVAYKWSEKTDKGGNKEGGLQRMYFHQQGSMLGPAQASIVSITGDILEGKEFAQAATALVSKPAICTRHILGQHPSSQEAIQLSERVTNGSIWHDLFEPGVKRALFVGIGVQVLQQASGMYGVLLYSPQILEQSGVVVLLSKTGLNSVAASVLISLITTLFMIPCIFISMRLIDVSGRKPLLLYTLPILTVALLAMIISSVANLGTILKAVIAIAGVMTYLCCFYMGFAIVPNILCAEIFPTRVRGLCLTICCLLSWVVSIVVAYSLPAMLHMIGLPGIFSIFAVGCALSWFFVLLKVPETKGMPLEVISEFFAMGATASAKND